MFKNPKRVFVFLCILAIIVAVFSLPETPITLTIPRIGNVTIPAVPRIDGTAIGIPWKKVIKTHLGLDLAGGSQLVLNADMTAIPVADRADSLESAREVVDRRVNFFGISEPVVQSARAGDAYRIIVELPGVTDVQEAEVMLGQTARLDFREFIETPDATASSFIPLLENTKSVDISGSDLKKATVEFNSQTGEPEVGISFTADGAKKFAEVTKRLVGKPLGIFLDDIVVTAPKVNTEISDGQAVISGSFTVEGAKTLAIQLNAGALPVPVSVVEKRTIGATLGAESVKQSVQAGAIGLGLVVLFMFLRYGRLGLLADTALIFYALITFALYRLIPITLTLPGIAGFILSIGMAVDSNILIFERYKEERRSGKPWRIAMELGFGKAWESIRDANFATIITSLILFNPGNWEFLPTSGLVRGFAATLFIGVIISLFTGIVVTRTLIRVLYKEKEIL